jgi:hypothetical protein
MDDKELHEKMSLDIKEMQMKTRMRHHYISKIKNSEK